MADRARLVAPFLRAFALVSLAACCWVAQASESGSDYLDPGLRERVESLKAGVAETVTSTDDLSHRARILWDWANAYARSGGTLPVNLTARVRPVLVDDPTPQAMLALDQYVRELTFLDEHPDGLGELTADLGPFEARDWVSLEQVYVVGEEPVAAGGGILVAQHFMPDYGKFQAEDPTGDNYVSISSSNPTVSFSTRRMPMSGMHGGFRRPQPALVFGIETGRLEKGDKIVITYGDRSGGSRGFQMPTMSTDKLPLPLYIDLNGDGNFFTLPIQPIRVVGTKVAGVHGFAPSVVRPGEVFDLSVRAQDRFYNRATGPLPAWQVSANGEPIRRIPQSNEAIHVIRDLSFAEPGVYRISIVSRDGEIRGIANPILVSQDAPRVRWGDTHGHSGFAEGIGTPDRFMAWAKEDARLDFVTHSEHDIWMDDAEWQVLIENVQRYSEAERFVAFLGYEWTTRNIFGGHHNVLFRTPENRDRVATQFHPTLSDLYQGLRDRHDPEDVIVIPHAHQAGDFRQSDPLLEPLVEIMSQHGTFEWFGRMYLSHGHQVGFIAASDNHLSQPGYTAPKGASLSQRGGLAAVMSPTTSRDGIFDAMRSLRTYATTGERMIVDVDLNGAKMGQRTRFDEDRHLSGRVIGTGPIGSISVVRSDQEIWKKDYLTDRTASEYHQGAFRVTFESSSTPFHPGDNPRGARSWTGTMRVVGADLVGFEGTDFVSPITNRLERLDSDGNALRFATATRGDTSSIDLQLANVDPKARIVLDLNPGAEEGAGPPLYRPHQQIAGAQVAIEFADLQEGETQTVLPVDGYQDTVTVRRITRDASDDVSFELHDRGSRQGDYYYVRIEQANGALAWTSPIWVGGFPTR